MSQVTRWPPLNGGSSGPTSNVSIVQGANTATVDSSGNLHVTGSSTITGPVSTDLNGLANFKTTKYTIGTSAVILATPALTNRSSMSFKAVCTGGSAIFIGNSSGVTTSTGYILFNGDSLQLDLTGATSPYAIADAAAQTLYVLEIG